MLITAVLLMRKCYKPSACSSVREFRYIYHSKNVLRHKFCERSACFIFFPKVCKCLFNFKYFGGYIRLLHYYFTMRIFYNYGGEHFLTCLLVILDTLFCQEPTQVLLTFPCYFSYRFVGALSIYLDYEFLDKSMYWNIFFQNKTCFLTLSVVFS